jgi:hypothetical protein
MKSHFLKTTISCSLAAVLCLGAATPKALGCATCGCSLNSEWESQGYSLAQGFKFDLLYNFIDQNQLWHGTQKISPSQVPLGQELEQYTHNNYVTFGVEYDFNADWGIDLQVPYIFRDHATLGEDHQSYDHSSSASIGDMKLIAHYQGILESHNLGVELGIKLPTGSFTDTFDDGAALDRGLQPGTGTWGLIAGVYYFNKIGDNWGYYALATVQTALDSREDYRPGTSENVSLGLRYTGIHHWVPELQVNGSLTGRDTGAQADNADSGGAVVYLSPGVTFEVNEKYSAFVYVQIPVYQNFNGYQLAPAWTLSGGIRVTF